MNQSSIVNDINAAAQELLREQPLITLRFYPYKPVTFDRYSI